ncbi:unnamed protein product [Echinostoma caproni]|uniref:Chromosome 1 open reading frame 172 n=1 Tax=Echinostoma caproni TaxID=27848 RepID=A0A183A9R7_9TREM|nr:unnamed protein product [Echinostoma caproni]
MGLTISSRPPRRRDRSTPSRDGRAVEIGSGQDSTPSSRSKSAKDSRRAKLKRSNTDYSLFRLKQADWPHELTSSHTVSRFRGLDLVSSQEFPISRNSTKSAMDQYDFGDVNGRSESVGQLRSVPHTPLIPPRSVPTPILTPSSHKPVQTSTGIQHSSSSMRKHYVTELTMGHPTPYRSPVKRFSPSLEYCLQEDFNNTLYYDTREPYPFHLNGSPDLPHLRPYQVHHRLNSEQPRKPQNFLPMVDQILFRENGGFRNEESTSTYVKRSR